MSRPAPAPLTLWVYAYRIAPSLPQELAGAIRVLLGKEHADALRTRRTWTGTLVREPGVTHILVVSDSDDQHREINHLLRDRLTLDHTEFSLSLPLVVTDGGSAARDP